MNEKIQLEEPVVNAIKLGHNIQAIKILRDTRRLGLKEAKDLVDQYRAQNPYIEGSPVTTTVEVTEQMPSLSEHAISAIQRGKKIAAIKIVREETGLGLKEAKDIVEEYEQKLLTAEKPLPGHKKSEGDNAAPYSDQDSIYTQTRKPKDHALALKIIGSLIVIGLVYFVYQYFS